MYQVFTRNWWKIKNGKRVPNPSARKTILDYVNTQEEARKMCEQWNKNNPAGNLSRKAEYTSNY